MTLLFQCQDQCCVWQMWELYLIFDGNQPQEFDNTTQPTAAIQNSCHCCPTGHNLEATILSFNTRVGFSCCKFKQINPSFLTPASEAPVRTRARWVWAPGLCRLSCVETLSSQTVLFWIQSIINLAAAAAGQWTGGREVRGCQHGSIKKLSWQL